MLVAFLIQQEYKEEDDNFRTEMDKFKALILGVNPKLYEILWKDSPGDDPSPIPEAEIEHVVPESEEHLKEMLAEFGVTPE